MQADLIKCKKNTNGYKQMSTNPSKYNQMQANVSKWKQIQPSKQMQANLSKCKQIQAIRIKIFENNFKFKEIDVKACPPRINTPSNWRFNKPKQLSEDNINNIVQRQFVKQIQENVSEHK